MHSLLMNLPTTAASKSQMHVATVADDSLVKLQQLTKSGWPQDRKDVPEVVRPNWNVRDQGHETEGFMFLEEKLIIPVSLGKCWRKG